MSALLEQAGLWLRQRVRGGEWSPPRLVDAAQMRRRGYALLVLLLALMAGSALWADAGPFRLLLGAAAISTLGFYVYTNALVQGSLQREVQQHCAAADADAVTGLAAYAALQQRLADMLEHARRNGSLVGAVTISLDNWPHLTAVGGEKNAALILRETAKRIAVCLRQTDMAARIQDGEFALMLCNLKSRRGMEAVIRRLQLSLNEPFVLAGSTTLVRATVGAAVFPFDAELPDDLFEAARADGEALRYRGPRALLQALG